MKSIPGIMNLLGWIALGIELLGMFFIVFGVGRSLIYFIRGQLLSTKDKSILEFNVLRKDFGEYLILGLEFLIAADVIHTMIHRELEQLYILGGIVLIRTVIGYFLKKEI